MGDSVESNSAGSDSGAVLSGLAWYSFLMMTMPMGLFYGVKRVGDEYDLFGGSKFTGYAYATVCAVAVCYVIIAKYVHRAYVEDSRERELAVDAAKDGAGDDGDENVSEKDLVEKKDD
jgi:hypothetical protein